MLGLTEREVREVLPEILKDLEYILRPRTAPTAGISERGAGK
jgi:hypothetical protein